MNKKIKFVFIFSTFLFIFIIFYFGLNKTNIYTPKKIMNMDMPYFESKELFSDQQTNSNELTFILSFILFLYPD